MRTADTLAGAIERLPGVLAASAFLDAPSGPRVYLAVSGDADAATLRETVLAILGDHGVAALPDRIHVGTAPAPPRPTTALPRFTLDGLETHRSDHQARCTVTLRVATRTTAGSAVEPDTRSGRARAAAMACMRAMEGLDPDLRLGLEGLRVLDMFGHDGVILVIEATAGRTHVHLPGAALEERSVEEAACRAALSALRSWAL